MTGSETGGRRLSRREFLEGAGAFVLLGASGASSRNLLASLSKLTATSGGESSLPATFPRAGDESSFTIFWITDTQYLSEKNPLLFSQMTGWIAKNWSLFNGKMVIHTGDIVETGSELREWVNADAAMSVLTRNRIPYVWCAGNHDDMVEGDPASGWAGSQFDSFNPEVVSGQLDALGYTSWAGDYHDGMNAAVTFNANGLDFLVVNLEWNAQADAISWMEGLLDSGRYKGYNVIVAPHAYEDATGSTNDTRWGPTLADFRKRLAEIMDAHGDSVFLTLNGHFATDSGYHTRKPIDGRNQLMFDRQESTDNPDDPVDSSVDDVLKVGGATVTLLTLDARLNKAAVRTFDHFSGEYRTGAEDQYGFAPFPEQATA